MYLKHDAKGLQCILNEKNYANLENIVKISISINRPMIDSIIFVAFNYLH